MDTLPCTFIGCPAPAVRIATGVWPACGHLAWADTRPVCAGHTAPAEVISACTTCGVRSGVQVVTIMPFL
jgi:hypothetical protein